MDDRGIDEPFLCLGVAARRHQRGFSFLRARSFIIARRIHAFAATGIGLAAAVA
jgi:hypothetical protein